jgi:putative CocE/NonD family hydrolase
MQQPEETGVLGIAVEEDVPVSMRDGVVLRANVYRPDTKGRFPAILMRSPYGKPSGGFGDFVRAGYVVVTQDTRGRYASEGDYVPFCVENTGDAEDGYDSVEWLARQPYCDGKVGTMGVSYCAWMQWMLARLRPPHLPHLLAMCACSIPLKLTQLDWPGAFRPGRRVRWWMTTMAPDLRRRQGLAGVKSAPRAREVWDVVEQARWLGFLPWLDLPRYLPPGLSEPVASWLRRPDSDPWRFEEAHRKVQVPNLDFSGWFDHCSGTMDHLSGMRRHAATKVARTQTRLVIGPWSHITLGHRQTGEIDFGPQAEVSMNSMMIKWFDRWLKGRRNGVDQEPAVRYFVMGSGKWKSADEWPPVGLMEDVYYLDGRGDTNAADGSGCLAGSPSRGGGCDTYVYDPRNPVPTLWTPSLFMGPSDRRRLEYREDILHYRTPPLEDEVEVVGYPRAVIYASSSATDTDFFARLVDEDPEGPALEICHGMVRARHRHSLSRQELLEPGEVTEFQIRLGPTACTFLRGHRIRLEITSSDFPNYDRNHNTGGNDLGEVEMLLATQKVFHSREHPSRLLVDIDQNP